MRNGLITDQFGTYWFLDDLYHKEDGPAIENCYGDKFWYINNKLHRKDGPALECLDGHCEWWIDGKLHGRNLMNFEDFINKFGRNKEITTTNSEVGKDMIS